MSTPSIAPIGKYVLVEKTVEDTNAADSRASLAKMRVVRTGRVVDGGKSDLAVGETIFFVDFLALAEKDPRVLVLADDVVAREVPADAPAKPAAPADPKAPPHFQAAVLSQE